MSNKHAKDCNNIQKASTHVLEKKIAQFLCVYLQLCQLDCNRNIINSYSNFPGGIPCPSKPPLLIVCDRTGTGNELKHPRDSRQRCARAAVPPPAPVPPRNDIPSGPSNFTNNNLRPWPSLTELW